MRTAPLALLALGALLGLALPLRAAPNDGLPPAAAAALEQARAACPAGLEAQSGFVRRIDVNGDGIADVVLDYSFATCGEDPNFFCGTGGCTYQVFASVGGGFREVYDETVREIRFRTVAGTPRLFASLHGSACHRTGYLPCEQTLAWDGTGFRVR
jgi:hypothetical protein